MYEEQCDCQLERIFFSIVSINCCYALLTTDLCKRNDGPSWVGRVSVWRRERSEKITCRARESNESQRFNESKSIDLFDDWSIGACQRKLDMKFWFYTHRARRRPLMNCSLSWAADVDISTIAKMLSFSSHETFICIWNWLGCEYLLHSLSSSSRPKIVRENSRICDERPNWEIDTCPSLTCAPPHSGLFDDVFGNISTFGVVCCGKVINAAPPVLSPDNNLNI